MRREWREYWYYFAVKSKHLLWTLPVSLLFFLGYLPESRGEYLTVFTACLGVGFCISLSMYVVWSLAWAVVVYIEVKTGKFRFPGLVPQFLFSFFASLIGVSLGIRWKAWLLGTPLESGFWSQFFNMGFLAGILCNLGFLFYYAYKSTKQENIVLQAVSTEAKYHALKNQMQPHFLFNSLNSLSELIESYPARASEMTQKLADLYREILENSNHKTASLRSEVSIVQKYCEVEKLRFGDRLDFDIDVPPNADSIYLPSLMLQTLVENSIKHGVARVTGHSRVSVAVVSGEKSGYEIRVTNSGAFPGERRGAGSGLSNTRSRLDLLYGPDHGFNLFSENGNTIARFTVTGAEIA